MASDKYIYHFTYQYIWCYALQAVQCSEWLSTALNGYVWPTYALHGKPIQTGALPMIEINVTIKGKTPLLCNRFTDAAQMASTSGTRSALTGDKGSPREQAEPKLYTDEKGKPIIPQPNLYRCIIDAGKFFKNGKSKVTTIKSSLIPSCVDLEGLAFPIKHSEAWQVDTRPVRIPATGGRILAHRPCFNDWSLSFTVFLDNEVMSETLFRDIVDKAGSAIGLGDFRPDCKGPFGKFVVTKWTSKALKKAA